MSSGKRVAIVQSNYIPWKGYFDLIASVDEFVLLDCVQYTRRDWRNRNRIKTPRGTRWLTIPVASKGQYSSTIADMQISDRLWHKTHWDALRNNYVTAKHFADYADTFYALYKNCDSLYLSEINRRFIEQICALLGINTEVTCCRDYNPESGPGKTRRLVEICSAAGATHYVSGPAAADYIDLIQFKENGIDVSYADYSEYPEYTQLHGPFVHEVSILDLIFNEGVHATNFMKYAGRKL